MTLTFGTYTLHVLIQLTASTNFYIVSEKSIALPSSHTKAYETKFDLAIK